MKLTLLQFIALFFVFGWTGGQAVGAPYGQCLTLGIIGAFIVAYLNDAHKILWTSFRKIFKKT